MRTVVLLWCVGFVSSVSLGQIPNSGFENWVDDGSGNVNPVGWETSNSTPYVSVDSVTPGHSGTYAMRVKTLDLGIVKLPGVAVLQIPYAFSETPAKFAAWVKSTIAPGDTAFFIVGLTRGDSVIALTDSCTFKIGISYTEYTYVEFPIAVVSGLTPDSLYIMIATGITGNPQAGTEIIVDDIGFVGSITTVSTVQTPPGSFFLSQNYPNPFNPETAVRYQLSDAGRVRLAVYDLLGREVALLIDEVRPAGTYTITWNAAGVSSGVYLIRMTTGTFSDVRKVVLAR